MRRPYFISLCELHIAWCHGRKRITPLVALGVIDHFNHTQVSISDDSPAVTLKAGSGPRQQGGVVMGGWMCDDSQLLVVGSGLSISGGSLGGGNQRKVHVPEPIRVITHSFHR